ncbi:MAG: ribonuclease HIII [Erysipelotrichaceae bacterium]|nr:ribonuclease HIII [Erysipelotrichaceae bacterium]
MATVSITLTLEEIENLKNQYPDAKFCKTPPYAYYQFKLSDCTITAYNSKKVVFQGEGANFHASSYQPDIQVSPIQSFPTNSYPQCGSDEVGTGDYFGPVIVCAAYIAKEQVDYVRSLNVQDSKNISDSMIRKIGGELKKRIPHSLLIVDNAKYNEVHPSNNMVAMKAKLHNKAYVHLQNKIGSLPKLCIVDQFVQESSYYRYLQQEPQVIQNLHFETKAESKYLAVATASIIARYTFLKVFDAMEKHYNFNFPKGAGKNVDESIPLFIKIHGKNELKKVAKLHFANTTKAGVLPSI